TSLQVLPEILKVFVVTGEDHQLSLGAAALPRLADRRRLGNESGYGLIVFCNDNLVAWFEVVDQLRQVALRLLNCDRAHCFTLPERMQPIPHTLSEQGFLAEDRPDLATLARPHLH